MSNVVSKTRGPATIADLAASLRSLCDSLPRRSETGGEWWCATVKAGTSPAACREALALLTRSAEPASDSALYAALAWLSSVTAMRDGSEEQGEMKLRAMAGIMSEYPAGIALEAIKNWPRAIEGKWWPTAAEMHQACEYGMGWRQAMQDGLERALNAPPALPPLDPMRRFRESRDSYFHEYFLHARIKLGLKEHDRFTEHCEFSEEAMHTTPEFAERLSTPPLDYLLELYGATIRDDFGARPN